MSTNFYDSRPLNGAFKGAPESCQIPLENNNGANNNICGETETLRIIQEFQKLYEEKLKSIDADTSGDSLEAKLKLQQDWIRDLTEQNTMLVQAVEELEQEATERVTMLEERLRQTASCGLAAMKQMPQFDKKNNEFYNNETLMRLNHLQHDATTLVEVIRRAREDGRWYTDGLQFYEISPDTVLGKDANTQVRSDLVRTSQFEQLETKKYQETNKLLQFQKQYPNNKSEEELKRLRESYAELQKSTTDMREALTAEVADKHDCILAQRREIQLLEEQCRQADKQTHFKDDIIKELRKEIKQGKHQQSKNNLQSKHQSHSRNSIPQYYQPHKLQKTTSICEAVERTAEKMDNLNVHPLKSPDLSLIDLKNLDHASDRSETSTYSSSKTTTMNKSYSAPPLTLSPEKLPKTRGNLSIQKVLHEFATTTSSGKVQQCISIFKYQEEESDSNGNEIVGNKSGECVSEEAVTTPSSDEVSKVIKVPRHIPVKTFITNIENGIGDLDGNVKNSTAFSAESDISYYKEHKECNLRTKRLEDENRQLKDGCMELRRQLKELRQVLMRLKEGVNWAELNDCANISPTNLTPHLQQILKEKGMTTSPRSKAKEINKMVKKMVQQKNQKIADQTHIVHLLTERLLMLKKNLEELEDKANKFVTSSACSGCEESEEKCEEKHELRRKLTEMEAKLIEIQGTFEKHRQSSTDEINTLAEEKNITFQEAESLRNELLSIRNDNKALRDENHNKSKKIEDLENTLKENRVAQVEEESRKKHQRQSSRPKMLKQDSFSEDDNKLSEFDVSFKSGTNLEKEELQSRLQNYCDCSDEIFKSRCSCGDTKFNLNAENAKCQKENDDLYIELDSHNNKIKQLEDALSTINNNNQLIKNKEEVIRIQNDTLNISEIELQALRKKVTEIDKEKLKNQKEFDKLTELCKQQEEKLKSLEASLQEAQNRADNLQDAVDLYVNSIQLLEDAKQRSEVEVNQQRITICNLQQALVAAKLQIDELQSKASTEFQEQFEIINSLYNNLLEAEIKTLNYQKQAAKVMRFCDRLKSGNLDLQVAFCNLEQDLGVAEERILKYKTDLTNERKELCKRKQMNQYYVGLIDYMHPEMNDISQKLKELQHTLSSATDCFQVERVALQGNVTSLCKKVDSQKQQLLAMNQKLCQYNQLNQINNSKIEELQHTIDVKMMAVSRYSNALQDVRNQLDSSSTENRELKAHLANFKVVLGEYEKTCERHEEKTAYCHKQMENFGKTISGLKEETKRLQDHLQCKCEEVVRLKELCKIQANSITVVHDGCKESRDQYESQLVDYKAMVQDLNNKLNVSEGNFFRLHEEYKMCQNKVLELVQKEAKQQEDFSKRENELLEKFRCSREQGNYLIAKMEDESQYLKETLEQKNSEIKNLKDKYDQCKHNWGQLQSTKDEINQATEEKDKLVMENQKLKNHLESLRNCNDCMKRQIETHSEELRLSREEINHLRQCKDQHEMKMAESQQTELQETKSSKDEVCEQSKSVVINVRSWLQEQRIINDNLADVVKKKNEQMQQLQTERDNLVAMIIDLRRRMQKYRALRVTTKVSHPRRLRLDSTGSRTSATTRSRDRSISPNFSSHSSLCSDHDMDDKDLYQDSRQFRNREYLSAEETARTDRSMIPTVWIRKVHSLTADIQKNNRYWKSKLNESEYMVSKDE